MQVTRMSPCRASLKDWIICFVLFYFIFLWWFFSAGMVWSKDLGTRATWGGLLKMRGELTQKKFYQLHEWLGWLNHYWWNIYTMTYIYIYDTLVCVCMCVCVLIHIPINFWCCMLDERLPIECYGRAEISTLPQTYVASLYRQRL